MALIYRLLDELREKHFVNSPATAESISRFEDAVGWRMEADMRAFYLAFDGARMFADVGPIYHILPLLRIERARVAILGQDDDEHGPAGDYAFCYVQDTDYVAIDIGENRVIRDCWHETYPREREVIARSFVDFLERALRSGGELYWL